METTELKENDSMQRLINELYQAYKFFNVELFNNLLPHCAISISSNRGSSGVYRPEVFVPIDLDQAVEEDTPKVDEIMLNPETFNRSELYVLSVLVHEMVHQWEQEYGKPGKGGYHNKYWAESMKAIGLQPSTTGEPGGKETGRKVSHYVVEGGLFEVAADKFISETGFSIDWFILAKTPNKRTPRKITYRCECPQPWYSNLSGRKAFCSECDTEFIEDEMP